MKTLDEERAKLDAIYEKPSTVSKAPAPNERESRTSRAGRFTPKLET